MELLCLVKLEAYCLDAKDCITNDPNFVKGYYRRGSAYVSLNQFDMAVQDFKTVCKILPNDKEARNKYEITLKEHKLRQFASCLGYEEMGKVDVDIESIVVENSYTGPKLESIDDLNVEWVI